MNWKVKEKQIENLVNKKGGKLLEFTYYKKIFGNVVAKIEYNNEIHEFVIDRGEIYHNKRYICNSSYQFKEKVIPLVKLLEIIDKELM